MSSSRVAISVPNEILERARLAVKQGKAPSLSAYVTLALEQLTKGDDFDAYLDAMLERNGGPMTEEERRRTDEILDRASSRAKRAGRGGP